MYACVCVGGISIVLTKEFVRDNINDEHERVNERILVLTYVNGSLHSVSLALLNLAEIIAFAWTTLGHEPRERSERK